MKKSKKAKEIFKSNFVIYLISTIFSSFLSSSY